MDSLPLSQTLNTNDSLFDEFRKKDLMFSVLKGGKWGSFRHGMCMTCKETIITVSDTLSIKCLLKIMMKDEPYLIRLQDGHELARRDFMKWMYDITNCNSLWKSFKRCNYFDKNLKRKCHILLLLTLVKFWNHCFLQLAPREFQQHMLTLFILETYPLYHGDSSTHYLSPPQIIQCVSLHTQHPSTLGMSCWLLAGSPHRLYQVSPFVDLCTTDVYISDIGYKILMKIFHCRMHRTSNDRFRVCWKRLIRCKENGPL